MIKITTEDTFRNDIAKNGITLVAFVAHWCKFCGQMETEFEELERRMPDITILLVDTDRQIELTERYEVTALPTILILQNGITLGKDRGFKRAKEMVQLINELAKNI